MALLPILFNSCEKEAFQNNAKELIIDIAHFRTANNLEVELTTPDSSIIKTSASSFAVYSTGFGYFTVVVNPNTTEEQTYTANTLYVAHNENGLHLVKQPVSNSEVTYSDKSSVNVTLNETNDLNINIDNGSIITTATSHIIGEEIDGI